MNEYLAQSIARQRMEETARHGRYPYRAGRPVRRSRLPRTSRPG